MSEAMRMPGSARTTAATERASNRRAEVPADTPRGEIDWLIATQAEAVRMMCTLSVKLRLNPQPRLNQAGALPSGSRPSFHQQRAQQQHRWSKRKGAPCFSSSALPGQWRDAMLE